MDTSNTNFVPWGDLDAMVAAINNQTAAVIMEPSPAQAGFPSPPEGYFNGIREAFDRHGALLVIDEVQTGMGSPGGGHFWGYQAVGFKPDIILRVENPIKMFSEIIDAGVLVIPSIIEPAIPFRPTLTQTPEDVEEIIAIVTGVLKR